MTDQKPSDSAESYEKALQDSQKVKYILRLYISGNTAKSARAIQDLRKVCEEQIKGGYELEVIDIYQQPTLAIQDQILATPTLVKKLPLPVRKMIGDMTQTKRILIGLQEIEVKEEDGSPRNDH